MAGMLKRLVQGTARYLPSLNIYIREKEREIIREVRISIVLISFLKFRIGDTIPGLPYTHQA
jgi:hypothetical protein